MQPGFNLLLLRFIQGIGRRNAQIHIGMRIHLAAPEAAQRQQRQLPCRLHLPPQRGNGVGEQGGVVGKKTLRAAVAAVVGNDLPFVLGQLLRQKLRGLRHGGIPRTGAMVAFGRLVGWKGCRKRISGSLYGGRGCLKTV